jgi:hypothetical protein
MKNINKLYLILFLLVAIMPLCSANLGTFTQDQPINIRVLANCSTVNLSEITLTNNNQVYVIDSAMTKLSGQTFNYTFINTSAIGHYTYSWNNPCVDCSSGDCGNSFDVTFDGNIPNTADSILFIIILAFLLLILIITIYGAWVMPFKNNRDEEGFVIGLNNLKYLKIVLWVFVYLEMLFIVMIAKNITYGSAIFNGAYQFFNIIFWLMLICLLPFFPLLIFLTVVIWLTDKKTQQNLERGIRTE